MVKSRRFALAFLACLAAIGPVRAQSAGTLAEQLRRSFPDNAEIRKKYFTALITAPKEAVWAFPEKVEKTAAGEVLVKTVKRSADFFVQFINGAGGGYPDYGRGSYLIERSAAKGYLVQAKVFLLDDPSCYARLYPQAETTRIDVIMYGAVLKKGLVVPGMFYTTLTRPFPELVAATSGAFNWSQVFPAGSASALHYEPLSPSGEAAPELALLSAADTPERFLTELAAAGGSAVELSGPFSALGYADDSEALTTRQPYADFPRYEPGRGLPAKALRAVLFLDSLGMAGQAYALFAQDLRVLALPSIDTEGSYRFAFFEAGGEIDPPELLSRLAGSRVRILRLGR